MVHHICILILFISLQRSEFHLDGDYIIGGLFSVHLAAGPVYQKRPEVSECSVYPFQLSHYRRFQMMRFSVEQINNSSHILPNVSIGYQIFDQCADAKDFPGIFDLVSVNDTVHPWWSTSQGRSNVIAVSGPFSSTFTLTTAPLLMVDLIPMVSYGVTGSVFSNKLKFPSFLRTVHPNQVTISLMVKILQHFNWRWVAFLNSADDFGRDGLDLFTKYIKGTNICLAYNKGLTEHSHFPSIFKEIEAAKITVVLVFAPEVTAENLVCSAIQHNINKKVWIADEGMTQNKRLQTDPNIHSIGTVIGVSQAIVTIPGFSDFILATKTQTLVEDDQQTLCNQICNCSGITPTAIINVDPSFALGVYSSVYAIAHALHNVLECEAGRCNTSITANPQMVFTELKKSNFTLLNYTVRFNKDGDPMFGAFSVFYWNRRGEAEELGQLDLYSSSSFTINSSKIQWFTDEVPTSLCSPECPSGFAMKQDGSHHCCFSCEKCPNGTYVNITENPYKCTRCHETEWSPAASTACIPRTVEYVQFSHGAALLTMSAMVLFDVLIVAVAALFAVHFNTPVVRSAGGPMCFLILACLCLSGLSISFNFDEPTTSFCFLRLFPFSFFYSICLSCFVVRSFQIVFIFKMASRFPKLYSFWTAYHGQWVLISAVFTLQTFLSIIAYSIGPTTPYQDMSSYEDKIILKCNYAVQATTVAVTLLVLLSLLCFVFSYMGKDLPKNYNEAQAITFCLMLLTLTWVTFITIFLLYQGKHLQTLNALAVLSSLYSFLLWYFLPKCYIILFQPEKNTPQYFQGLIQNYTKTISQ
ncbi:taste receptor type 1 member 1-like [Synchiropus splendidus]|uniref:taste receptor type 1 member 1-like n=1 Tax=Synchiropus splendidus TaxID=270530 RepID=UPI00237E6279|nr:taste receptor type 1 member 1-like [Synchiropus splendidus]